MDGVRVFEIRYDRWCGWLLGLLGLGRRQSNVAVGPDTVDVRMGWAFRATIPRAHLVGAERADRPFLGWGVHGWRGRWLVNGSMRGLVALQIEPPVRGWTAFVPLRLRTVVVSLADPEAFLVSTR